MSESKPISGDALFDTNAASGLIRQVESLLAAVDPDCRVLLPLAVVGELIYGAEHAASREQQLERVHAFVAAATVVLPDQQTAEKYARIKAELRRAGSMIPENDLWIAATALQHNLPLVSQDRHLQAVASIQLVTW